jgi:hypothetical protein
LRYTFNASFTTCSIDSAVGEVNVDVLVGVVVVVLFLVVTVFVSTCESLANQKTP